MNPGAFAAHLPGHPPSSYPSSSSVSSSSPSASCPSLVSDWRRERGRGPPSRGPLSGRASAREWRPPQEMLMTRHRSGPPAAKAARRLRLCEPWTRGLTELHHSCHHELEVDQAQVQKCLGSAAPNHIHSSHVYWKDATMNDQHRPCATLLQSLPCTCSQRCRSRARCAAPSCPHVSKSLLALLNSFHGHQSPGQKGNDAPHWQGTTLSACCPLLVQTQGRQVSACAGHPHRSGGECSLRSHDIAGQSMPAAYSSHPPGRNTSTGEKQSFSMPVPRRPKLPRPQVKM